jgi:hypothetical protein
LSENEVYPFFHSPWLSLNVSGHGGRHEMAFKGKNLKQTAELNCLSLDARAGAF